MQFLQCGFADLADDLPDADCAILLAYSSFLTPSAMATAFAVHMLGDDGRLVTRFQVVP